MSISSFSTTIVNGNLAKRKSVNVVPVGLPLLGTMISNGNSNIVYLPINDLFHHKNKIAGIDVATF